MRFTLRLFGIVVFLFVVTLLTPVRVQAQAEDPVVYAVLFYSPTCPHCHDVMENDLPPLLEQYGDQLQILAVNTTTQSGSELYSAMLEAYSVTQQRVGVPALLIDGQHLVGSGEIPDQLPDIVAEGLAQGGIGLPFIPGLAWPTVPVYGEFLMAGDSAEVQATDSETTTQPVTEVELEPVPTDSVGFALAWVILIGMIAALIYVIYRLIQGRPDWSQLPPIASWAIPVLVVIGLGVAAYLAYVELTHVEAVCGPVGECNRVQSSSYATLAGVPVAVLGLVSYLTLGILWLVQRFRTDMAAMWSRAAMLAVTMLGTLFSIYLTLIEIFAIHAVCMWCLTSAVVTAALMIIVAVSILPVTKSTHHKARPKRA